MLEAYGTSNDTVKQLIDLALLANNMLRGEELSTFVKRSVDLL
jgi:molecular chaperone HtpG